jgi:hypothetical protein
MKPKKNPKNTTEKLPGYPHYPENEDIMHTDDNAERVDVDIEKVTRNQGLNKSLKKNKPAESSDEKLPAGSELNESDVSEEDLAALRMDVGDDDVLSSINHPFDDSQLDVPGAELDDDDEFVGSEDEENNYYSLGGDAHENLEERKD